MEKPIVTITGVTGYVGSQVCLSFLQSGLFKVRGTVRDLKSPKVEAIKRAYGQLLFAKLELVEADLMKDESLMKATAGSKYIVHTASPFVVDMPKDEMVLIKPAVNGTISIMRAAHEHKVKRVVITSSNVAILVSKDPFKVNFSVKDWSDLETGNAYEKSKTLAEQAAWDYLDAIKPSERFEVVSINPGLVLGPNFNSGEFASSDIMKMFMMSTVPGVPRIKVGCVDVRDVAHAHLQAVLMEQAKGQRFMLVERALWLSDIGKILHEKYGKEFQITRHELPYVLCRVGSFFSSDLKHLVRKWGVDQKFDNESTKEVLKVEFQDVRKAVAEMGDTLIARGQVEMKKRNICLVVTSYLYSMVAAWMTPATPSREKLD